jgi:hypothetical protein
MVESNHAFDKSLRDRNSEWGIRELEEVKQAARKQGLELAETVEMPSNNLCCLWRRIRSGK